jgi:hypothetical protein
MFALAFCYILNTLHFLKSFFNFAFIFYFNTKMPLTFYFTHFSAYVFFYLSILLYDNVYM